LFNSFFLSRLNERVRDAGQKEGFKVKFYHKNSLTNEFEVCAGSKDKVRESSHPTFFSERDPSSLDLRVSVAYKDSTGEKLGNLFKHGHFHNRKQDLNFSPKLAVPQSPVEIQDFNLPIANPKGVQFDLLFKWRLETQSKDVTFNLVKDEFRNYHMREIVNEYNAFDLRNIDFSGPKGECIGAQHRVLATVNSLTAEIYKCEVLHIPSIQWSSIRVLSSDEMRMMTTSNLIGLAQLPMRSQMQDVNYQLDLDPQFEKAMLVKNGEGDYAIVKGKWVGLKRGIPPVGRGRRGVRGDPGHLQVVIGFLKENVSLKIDIPSTFKFNINIRNTTAIVDMQTARLDIRVPGGENVRSGEVENLIATVLSISTLHVLLQPKQSPFQKVGDRLVPRAAVVIAPAVRGALPVRSVASDNFLLLSMIGYYELINAPCFINHYCPPHYDGGGGSIDPLPDNGQNDFCNADGGSGNSGGGDNGWIFNDCDGQNNGDGGIDSGGKVQFFAIFFSAKSFMAQ
jgi:hypothetical protein